MSLYSLCMIRVCWWLNVISRSMIYHIIIHIFPLKPVKRKSCRAGDFIGQLSCTVRFLRCAVNAILSLRLGRRGLALIQCCVGDQNCDWQDQSNISLSHWYISASRFPFILVKRSNRIIWNFHSVMTVDLKCSNHIFKSKATNIDTISPVLLWFLLILHVQHLWLSGLIRGANK